MLLTLWRRTQHIPLALTRLETAPEWSSRTRVADGLTSLIKIERGDISDETRREIVTALARQLRKESDSVARLSLYEDLLAIAGDDGTKQAALGDVHWLDDDKLIDWSWLIERIPELRS